MITNLNNYSIINYSYIYILSTQYYHYYNTDKYMIQFARTGWVRNVTHFLQPETCCENA